MPRHSVNTLLLALVAIALSGCFGRTRVEDSHADLIRPIHSYQPPARKTYRDARLSTQHPETWTVAVVDTGDPKIYAVEMRSPENLYARVTVVKRPGGTGKAMPDEVLEGLRRGYPDLKSDAYKASQGGQPAQGHRYAMRLNEVAWRGWVVSRVEAGYEVCFLGQHPRDIPDNLRGELTAVMNSLRLQTAPGGAAE